MKFRRHKNIIRWHSTSKSVKVNLLLAIVGLSYHTSVPLDANGS